MRVQLAWTVMTELLVMISGLLLLKLAASFLGATGFGEYTVSRRAISLLQLPLVMGLGIAAPRYIAVVRAGSLSTYSERGFAIATFATGSLPVAFALLILNLSPGTSARVLFGSDSLSGLVAPASTALAGLALHSLVYAVYRGRSLMGFANSLQLANLAIVPLAAFGAADGGAAAVLSTTGAAWLVLSAVGLAHLTISGSTDAQVASRITAHARVLLRYGVPRVPGEFALVGLFAVPALIAVREHGVVQAGQLSAAMSVLTIVAGVFAPVGLVVLPRASAQAAAGDLPGLRRLVVRILGAGMLLAVGGVAVGELAMPALVGWYLGPDFAPAVPVFRACLAGAIPYVAYVLMRNILDAMDVKAVNSRNLIVALAVLTALCLANSGIMWMALSLVASLVVLGTLTLRDTWIRLSELGPATVGTPA